MSNPLRKILTGAAVGLILTVPLMALMFLGQQLANLPMVAFDLFERITRIPQLGGVVTKGIDVMVGVFSRLPGGGTDTASKNFERFSGLVLFAILGAIAGITYVLLRGRIEKRYRGLTFGLAAWVVSLAAEFGGPSFHFLSDLVWLGVLTVIWGYVLTWTIDQLLLPAQPVAVDPARRRLLSQLLGGAALITLGGWGVGNLFGRRTPSVAGQSIPNVLAGTPTPQPSNGTFVAVPHTRPEITANEDFYRVDVNVASVPAIDEKTWKLAVEGLVNTPLKLSYDEILKMPAVQQYATLECISNPVGGDLISTTLWTGVKLRDVLNQAGLKEGVQEIKFTSDDGYTESLPLESALDERTLLAYAMNGMALPMEHGFPLRVYTPNRYGMKNPKWLTGIEAVDQSINGYWEVRGWNKQAVVKTTSIVDIVAVDQAATGTVPIGGIAFAGGRGISKVELLIDGKNWQEAVLKTPIAPLVWTLWRFDWPAASGHHELRVRATDGQGKLQTEEVRDLHPDGASGYVWMQFDI